MSKITIETFNTLKNNVIQEFTRRSSAYNSYNRTTID